MKKVFFTMALLFYALAYGQSTCLQAEALTIELPEQCNLTAHSFGSGDQYFWFSFTATSTGIDFVVQSDPQQTNPIYFTTVDLQQGDCYNVTPIDQQTINGNNDTLRFTGLTLGQNYQLKLERSNVSSSDDFQVCASSLAQGSYWTNNFTNSSGGVMLNCRTELNIDIETSGNLGCNEITVCINDILNLEIIAPIEISGVNPQPNPCEHYLVFENQNGAIANPVPYTEIYLTNLSFTQTGTVSFYLIPTYFPANAGAFQSITTDPEEDFLFTVHVVGEQPEAVWDSQSICQDGTATLTSLDFSTFSNVTVDGVSYPASSFQVTFNSNDFTVGTHIVEYTLTGACGPVTYTTTFTVLEENGFTVTSDNCGNTVFEFNSCILLGNFNATLNCGDGTTLTGQVVNGTIQFTHHYTTQIPVNWTFLVEYPNGIDAYSENGTFTGVVVQPITITAPEFSCELNQPITITSPSSGLSGIVWSTDPSLFFGGQGTTTLIPNQSWGNSTSDITVEVVATDANGCTYYGEVIIENCCGPKGQPPDNEYFERTYYNHTSFSGLNSQLPAGYYNAPTNVAISLPPAPSNVISTSYSFPVTLTSLIASSGWNVNNGVLQIPQTLYLNNDLIIDQSILITSSHYIRLAPNARIIVNPSVNFKMVNSTLAPKCEEMWGGILLPTLSGSLILDRVNVVGAIRGVQVVEGSDIDISTCVFVDNYIGVQIDSDGGAIPSKIKNTYFGDVTNAPLLFPYNTQLIPEKGIYLIKVINMTVGSNDPLNASPTSKGNLFHNMKIGIDATKSTFNSYRNAFYNMKHAPGQATPNEGDKYSGIRADNFKGSVNTLVAGSNTTNRNIFVLCDFGISVTRGMNLDARFNYLRDTRLRGISGEDNKTRTLSIWDNQFNSTNPNSYGVYLKNYAEGVATVNRNVFNTSAGALTNFLAKTASGIFVATVTPNIPQTTTIQGNTINNCLYSIWVLNVKSALVSNNTININFTNASVNDLTANYANIRGIIAQNADKVLIRTNTITRNNGSALDATNTQIQGIRLEICPSSEVWKNTMTRTAVGFYALGSNIGSKVECNLMQLNRNGFFMESADISNQGNASGFSAHNKWTANFLNNTSGTTINHNPNPLYYYHAPGAAFGSNPTPVIAGSPYNWFDITLNGATTTTCGNSLNETPITLTTPAQDRSREMGAVVNGGVIYDSLDVEMKHYLHQSVLSRLKQNPALQNLNQPDDASYQYYVLSMEQSPTGKLLKTQTAIANEQNDSAQVYINSLDISDPKIALTQTVETIWNSAKLNETIISTSDSLILFDIACSDPLINGSAVYQARAILDWDGTCAQMMQRSSIAVVETEQTRTNIIVYPNPSKGEFSINASSDMEKIEIIDLKGAILSTFSLDANNYEVKTQLKAGIYVLRVSLNNGTIETHKIEIH